jgi:uncharacterized protein with gpF-like domain
MIQYREAYSEPVQKQLEKYFGVVYWAEILEALKDPLFRMNDVNPLVDAIRKGKIQYQSGRFTGEFNMKTSRALEKFAKYDGRSRSWVGTPPPQVAAASVVANDRARALNQKITSLIEKIPGRVAQTIDELKYSIDTPLFLVNRQADKDLTSLGLDPDIGAELSETIYREYKTNQDINIKNWTDKQTERMRDMIEKNVLSGYNRRELEQMIMTEYGTTMSKARFLARQETSLLVSKIRDERYIDAGLDIVQWSTSGDIRVTGAPGGPNQPGKYEPEGHGNHYLLQSKYCKLSDPTVYADTKDDAIKGKWKSKSMIGADNNHAGRAWLCRCTYKPVIV